MQPIKFVKVYNNIFNYETMILVNIVSHKKKLLYFFIVQCEVKSNGIKTIYKEVYEFSEKEYNLDILPNYKII